MKNPNYVKPLRPVMYQYEGRTVKDLESGLLAGRELVNDGLDVSFVL